MCITETTHKFHLNAYYWMNGYADDVLPWASEYVQDSQPLTLFSLLQF